MERSSVVPASSNALAALGLAPTEERIYRMLLPRDEATAAEVSAQLKLSLRSSQRVLGALEKKGLITRSPEHIQRYSAVPADIAVEVLIAGRQSELHNARLAMAKLRDSADSERKGRRVEGRVIEIMSPQAAAPMFIQFIRSAREEILAFDRMPVIVSDIDKPHENLLACLARGVRCRSIVDSELLNTPGTLGRLRASIAAGEQYRTLPSLPFKLLVFDRRTAIIPLQLAQPSGPMLLVRSSSLLDALCEMFEMCWRGAAPLLVGETAFTAMSAPDSGPLHADPLVALLASGMNDKTIEHEFGVSPRTLARRIVELTVRLGASTRFQAGWLAAQAMHDEQAARVRAG